MQIGHPTSIRDIELDFAIKRCGVEEKVKKAVYFYDQLEAVCEDCLKENERERIICLLPLKKQEEEIDKMLEEEERLGYGGGDLEDYEINPLHCFRCFKTRDVYLISHLKEKIKTEEEENRELVNDLRRAGLTEEEIRKVVEA